MLPNEPCIVSDEVREVLDRVQKQGGKTKLTDLITAVDESGEGVHQPADRFEIIQGLIEPAFLELFKKDVEDRKNQKQKEKREKGEPGEPSNNEPFDDDPFEDAIPDPIDFEDLEKEMKKITDAVAKKKADAIQKALGVSQEDYDAYKKDFKIVEKFIENLSKAFDAVIERRKTYQRKLRRPVVEGVVLSPARIATAVAEIKTGNMDSRAMLDYEEREMIRTRPSDLEFTLVCDGSGSMKGNQKEIMQRRLAIMVTEALAAFQERIEKARRGGDKISLDVSSEVRIFDNDDRVVKPLGVTLTHKERVAMHQQLRQLRENQSNNEVATFEGIRSEQFNKDRIEKLQKGDVKKVILFLTDGESDTSAIQAQIASLERLAAGGRAADSDSLVIAGIGFEGGESVRTTYAPNGYYAESFDKISDIFEKFLEEILDKL
ncbi:MAG: VWA domain-containing protein, partial [Candidatus Magasanikbacteria bacterium]|nr:VWA domain-containing protein [Candidatus Magasanikbacteria bacterium]